MSTDNLVRRCLVFLVGLFVMAFGVALSVKANLGVSPISCIPYIFSERFPLSMGQTTILFNVLLILLQIVVKRRKYATQSQASPCEGPDMSTEGVHLQYSITGTSGPWVDINYWDPNGGYSPTLTNWGHYTENITGAAVSATTAFRFYQNVTSGNSFDHWGLDDVSINCPSAQSNFFWSTGSVGTNGGYVSPVTTQSYIVVLIDSLGNIAQDTITITVQPEPEAYFTASSPISFGQSSTINYTGNCTPAALYTWDFDGGTVNSGSGQGPYQISWNTPGTYTISLTVVENGCVSTPYTQQVIVGQALELVLEALPDSICSYETSQIVAHASGGDGGPYLYDFGIGISNDSILNPTPSTTTTYVVTVSDNSGSTPIIDSIELVIFESPIADFIGDPIAECIPFTVSFNDLSTTNCTSWEWDFGDPAGVPNNTSTSQNPSYNYTNAGTYDIILIVTNDNGCKDTVKKSSYITAHPLPTAAFYADPTFATSDDAEISFYNNCTNALFYFWNFGDNASLDNTSTDENPTHYYSGPGEFTVQQYVETAAGCSDSISRNIIIEHKFGFYVPSAFTPNGDGINDEFFPKGVGIDINSYTFIIYDRWGQVVFRTREWSDNYSGRWNGKLNGDDVPQGTYSYIIEFNDLLGKKYEYLGSVTLYR